MKQSLLPLIALAALCHSTLLASEKNGWSQFGSSQAISSIAMQNKICWISTYGGGLFKLDTESNSFTQYTNLNSPLPSNLVNKVVVSPNGLIWIATNEGIASFNGNIWKVFDRNNSPFVHQIINAIDIDDSLRLWVSSKTGIFRYDGKEWINVCDRYPGFNVKLLYGAYALKCTGCDVWMNTWDSTVRLRKNIWDEFPTGESFPYNHSSIPVSSDGTLWLPDSKNKCIYGIGKEPIQSYPAPCANFMRGNLLIGSMDIKCFIINDTFYQEDNGSWIQIEPPDDYRQVLSSCIGNDNHGNLWFASKSKLFCYKPDQKRWNNYQFQSEIENHYNMQIITLDTNGCLWGQYANTIYSFDTKTWSAFPLPSGDYSPYQIAIDNQNNLRISGRNFMPNTPDLFFCAVLNRSESAFSWKFSDYNITSATGVSCYSKSQKSWICCSYNNTEQKQELISVSDQSMRPLPCPSQYRLNSITETVSGTLWALDYNYNLYCFKDSAWKQINTSKDKTDTITTIINGAGDSIWVAIKNSGIALFNGSNWVFFDSSKTGFSYLTPKYYNQKQKDLWCKASRSIRSNTTTYQIPVGLYRFDGSKGELYTTSNSGIFDSEILSVTADDKAVWVASQSGLSRWDYSESPVKKDVVLNKKSKCSMQLYCTCLLGNESIKLRLNKPGNISIMLYDLSGRYAGKLNCGILGTGRHVIPIKMDNKAQKIYLAKALMTNMPE